MNYVFLYADNDVKRIFPRGELAEAEGLEFQNSFKRQTMDDADSNPLAPFRLSFPQPYGVSGSDKLIKCCCALT